MIAILGGLGAALLFAVSTIGSARSGRTIGATSSVAWVMAFGLLMTLPLLAASGPVPALTPAVAPYLVGSGLGSVVGLALFYRAIQLGKIGIATAIASTEGAVAAVISVVRGEPLTVASAAMLVVIAAGIVAVALVSDDASREAELEAGAAATGQRRLDPAAATTSILLAILAAATFGLGLYSTGQLSHGLPLAWAILPARVGGTLILFVPLLVTRRLRLTRDALPFVLAMAASEVFGTISYAVGARESVAVAAVLASQYAAVAAVAAYLLFRERLTVRQRSGVVAICLGVAVLAGLRA